MYVPSIPYSLPGFIFTATPVAFNRAILTTALAMLD
jgi:hypothetical protein